MRVQALELPLVKRDGTERVEPRDETTEARAGTHCVPNLLRSSFDPRRPRPMRPHSARSVGGWVILVLALAITGGGARAVASGPGLMATPGTCIRDQNGGTASTCTSTSPGLSGASDVALSPDGTTVYVVGYNDDSIVVFHRNPSSGALSPIQCIKDHNNGSASVPCTQAVNSLGLHGMGLPTAVTVSPDGKSVYAVSRGDNAIVTFGRASDGTLTTNSATGCIEDASLSSSECSSKAAGLLAPYDVKVSPDNASVYVASIGDNAVSTFSRSTTTGALTPVSCDAQTGNNPAGCAVTHSGLLGAGHLAISPNGTSLYVSAYNTANGGAITTFTRTTSGANTGKLAYATCVQDPGSAASLLPEGCPSTQPGLVGPWDMELSPDGSSLYVPSVGSNALVRFDRSATGVLTGRGCVVDAESGGATCALSASGLAGAISVTVDPDGHTVYVAGQSDSAITSFDRDTTPGNVGALAPVNCVKDSNQGTATDACFFSTDGLDNPRAIAVAPASTGPFPILVAAGVPGHAGLGADALTILNRASGPTFCQLNPDDPSCQPALPCDPTLDPTCGGGTCDPTLDPTCGAPDTSCLVPKLKGKKLRAAKARLISANCRLGRVIRKRSSKGTVKAQKPRAGTVLPAGGKVGIRLG